MSVQETNSEINEELRTAVQQVLSTAEARREEVEALSKMRGMDLMDQDVMSGAWTTAMALTT